MPSLAGGPADRAAGPTAERASAASPITTAPAACALGHSAGCATVPASRTASTATTPVLVAGSEDSAGASGATASASASAGAR